MYECTRGFPLALVIFYSFWINTNRVDECIGVGTNACLCVTSLWTQPNLFLANLSFLSRVCRMMSWLHISGMLHAPWSVFVSSYICYSLPPFLSHCEIHMLTSREEETCALSPNTLNLNSLLIKRYVTSLTLPSSPPFSSRFTCTHLHLLYLSISPTTLTASVLLRLFSLIALHSLSFLPFSLSFL